MLLASKRSICCKNDYNYVAGRSKLISLQNSEFHFATGSAKSAVKMEGAMISTFALDPSGGTTTVLVLVFIRGIAGPLQNW